MNEIEEDYKKLTEDQKQGWLNHKTIFLKQEPPEYRIQKITIMEKSAKKLHHLLIEAMEGGTHCHKKNMVRSLQLLLHLLSHQIHIHPMAPITNYLKEKYNEPILRAIDLLQPIHEIIMADFTHWEQKLLLKPYWFEFCMAEISYASFENRYATLINKLVDFVKTLPEEVPQEGFELSESLKIGYPKL